MNHTKQEKRYKKKGSSKLYAYINAYKENQFPITAAAGLLNKKAPLPHSGSGPY